MGQRAGAPEELVLMTTISVKNGETFSRACTWKIDGTAVNLTGYTVACRGTDRANTPIDLTVTLGDQGAAPGTFAVSATAAQTAAWIVGALSCDVSFTSGGGVVAKSATFSVTVERSSTP